MQLNKKNVQISKCVLRIHLRRLAHDIEATVESGKRERSGEYCRSLLQVEIQFLEILKRRKERENRPQDSVFTVL